MAKKRLCNVLLDGEVVFHGTYSEIAQWMCTTEDAVRSGANHRRMFQFKYWVDHAGWQIDNKKKKEKKVKMTKHEQKLDYLVRHLNEFGNTVLLTNPKEYQEELAERGYLISWEKVRDGKYNSDRLTASDNRGKKSYFYVIKLLNEVPKQDNKIIMPDRFFHGVY